MKSLALPATIDALLVTNLLNVRYLTGFSGSSGIAVLTENKLYFLTDGRYTEQAEKECAGCEILITNNNLYDLLNDMIRHEKIERLGYEAETLTVQQLQHYKEKLHTTLFSTEGYIETFRQIKTEDEIQNIKSAVRIASESYLAVLEHIREGVSEIELAAELDYQMKRRGAEKNSFDTICVSGYNSSLIHGSPTSKKIQRGDAILMDFGCVYKGYCSDMTRTVFLDEPGEEEKKVYRAVQNMQENCLKLLKAGVAAKMPDEYIQNALKEAGFDGFMNHSTGHSLGLEVHESPALSVRSDATLKENMLMTCEPGIYLPGKIGVRIEDLVVIKKDGIENLTENITKEMIVLS